MFTSLKPLLEERLKKNPQLVAGDIFISLKNQWQKILHKTLPNQKKLAQALRPVRAQANTLTVGASNSAALALARAHMRDILEGIRHNPKFSHFTEIQFVLTKQFVGPRRFLRRGSRTHQTL